MSKIKIMTAFNCYYFKLIIFKFKTPRKFNVLNGKCKKNKMKLFETPNIKIQRFKHNV